MVPDAYSVRAASGPPAAASRAPARRRSRTGSGARPVVGLLASMPVLWLLGGERLVSPILVAGVTVAAALGRPAVRRGLPSALGWAVVFLAAYLVSGFQVEGAGRVLTFLWDFSLYFASFCLMFSVYRYARTPDDIRAILRAAVALMVFSHALTTWHLLFGPIEFETLLGRLLPGEVRATATGQMVAFHSVGRDLWFFGLGDRVSGIFGPSIHLGSAILLSIPIIYVLASEAKGVRRLSWTAFAVLSLVILVYSQARTAMVITAGTLPALLLSGRLARSRLVTMRLIVPIAAFAAIVFLAAGLSLAPAAEEAARGFFVDARRSSADTRFEIYRQTAAAIVENPVTGHGTQRDVSDLRYPLGSHSWYLAILYKHGLLGFVPFLAFLVSVHAAGIRALRRYRGDPATRRLVVGIVVALLGHAALVTTVEPIVSALHLYMFAVLAGAAITIGRMRPIGAGTEAGTETCAGTRVARGRAVVPGWP